ncbi:4-hydroxyphenylpyruvate dioxygenase [Quillaja saponaria]|uniref:4-hydroxyphenylpyruvate dioxygenase n=1 Tax=Quillaja saponaria TaxID=32244 RepID=A0AAD7PRP9_QUISA|nr:4-hydroxyphenylpyruvate dioxygenase [Quillaja saponaria]
MNEGMETSLVNPSILSIFHLAKLRTYSTIHSFPATRNDNNRTLSPLAGAAFSAITTTTKKKTQQRQKQMGKQNDSVSAPSNDFKLKGFKNFVRTNPRSDRFTVKRFHHIEFWCTDASNTARRFSWGLGMHQVAKSDLSTGNLTHASYLLRSGELCFLFTAPYSPSIAAQENVGPTATASIPTFDHAACRAFSASHGLAVRSIAMEVEDAEIAFSNSVANGAKPSSQPIILDNRAVIAEVQLYGDVVLRYISYKNPSQRSDRNPDSWFLPKFEQMDELSSYPLDFGIRRLDHAVGNVPELARALAYVKQFTGFHEFAEFTAEDVGTSESGLNSSVLANNEETLLLPINEPVFGTKRKSQIQTYLEHNEGAGVQHLALMSEDIFKTLREMRRRSGIGGFEFMPSPPPTYFKNLKSRAGDVLTNEQIKECEELGILVDRDDQGTLLQIFTKPVGDRPTIFIEIIQRVGCMLKDDKGNVYQKGGCGGFGKGNFSELFKSIEEYEKMLEAKRIAELSTT